MGSLQHSPRTGTGNCRSSAPNTTIGWPSGDTWRPPDLGHPRSASYRATRAVRSKNADPYNGCAGQARPRTGSHVAHSLHMPRLRDPEDTLIGAQCWPCRPHDATGESVNELCLPRRNDSFPWTPLHYTSGCDRAAPPDRGRAPLNGRAILWSEATQGRTSTGNTNRGAHTDGQERRRQPSARPSGEATPTDQRRDNSLTTHRPKNRLDTASPLQTDWAGPADLTGCWVF